MRKIIPILYYLFYPILFVISIMPFRLHYWVSHLLYLIGYHIIGYRKDVVRSNLMIAFPEKTEKERENIEKKFYSFFFDIIVECIKSFTITKRQIKKRIKINPELLDLVNSYFDQDRNIFVIMSHYGNWEYGNFGAQIYFKHQVNCIYRKLSNPFFDYLLFKLRTRWGSGMFPMKQAYRHIVQYKKETHATGFIADQSSDRNNSLWLSFFGKKVPFFIGIETMSKKLNTPVIYIYFDRNEDKTYELKGKLLVDNPDEDSDKILSRFAIELEDQIRRKPEFWLWTHRRWKRVKE